MGKGRTEIPSSDAAGSGWGGLWYLSEAAAENQEGMGDVLEKRTSSSGTHCSSRTAGGAVERRDGN